MLPVFAGAATTGTARAAASDFALPAVCESAALEFQYQAPPAATTTAATTIHGQRRGRAGGAGSGGGPGARDGVGVDGSLGVIGRCEAHGIRPQFSALGAARCARIVTVCDRGCPVRVRRERQWRTGRVSLWQGDVAPD